MLITFESTTAAFRAKKYIEDFLPHLDETAAIVPLPFELSNTCYGNGLAVKASDSDAKILAKGLKEDRIGVKHFWSPNKYGLYEVIDEQVGFTGGRDK